MQDIETTDWRRSTKATRSKWLEEEEHREREQGEAESEIEEAIEEAKVRAKSCQGGRRP